jgi:hypothetical protein
MKICTCCNTEKDDDEFYWKNKSLGKRQSYCKECQNLKSKEHYEDNKPQYVDRAKKQRVEIAKW